MILLRLFTDKAPNKVFLSMLLGAVAGIGYSLLIPLVLVSVVPGSGGDGLGTEMVRPFLWLEVSNYKFALLFVSLCVLVLACRSVSQILLTRVALDATTELRITTYRQIMKAPIDELEKMGSSKLIVAITTDVGRIVHGRDDGAQHHHQHRHGGRHVGLPVYPQLGSLLARHQGDDLRRRHLSGADVYREQIFRARQGQD